MIPLVRRRLRVFVLEVFFELMQVRSVVVS